MLAAVGTGQFGQAGARLLPAPELSPGLADGTGRLGRRAHGELDQRPGMPDAVRALVEKPL